MNCRHSVNGYNQVKWDDVCCTEQKGVRSIRPLCVLNAALIIGWVWSFAKEDEDLWKNVVKMDDGTNE